jgi:hypothetical protein
VSRARGIAALVVVAAVAAGCAAAAPTPTTRPSGAPEVLAPPTLAGWNGLCTGVGLFSTTLTGHPADPRVAWLRSPAGRHDAVFPPGFTARFSPRLEVLDPTGKVVGREGDDIDGGCVTGPNADGPLLIFGL